MALIPANNEQSQSVILEYDSETAKPTKVKEEWAHKLNKPHSAQ